MKSIQSALEGFMQEAQKASDAAEVEARQRAGKRTALQLVTDESGAEVTKLLPANFSFADYTMLNTTSVGVAKRRLKLCATCPPHGGACASEYELHRGRAPKWDENHGLHMDWCPRWPEYTVRDKLQQTGVHKRLLGCRLQTFEATTELQKAALDNCAEYARRFRRGDTASNLIIFGKSYGVGKTHLAIGVVANLIASYRLRNALFAYVPEFLERIRRSYEEPEQRNLIERASTTDLLVLDDLAAQRTTDWVREQINLISNARWGNGLPTIITTNAHEKELADTLGPRATSRFYGDAFAMDVDGEDRRKVVDG